MKQWREISGEGEGRKDCEETGKKRGKSRRGIKTSGRR